MTTAKNLRLACQTITWGPDQANRFHNVFWVSAEAGYEGLEIGFRHIQAIPPRQLAGMLAGYGLELVATHIGGNLQDTDQAEGERRILDRVIDYLSTIGARLLMYSGLRFENQAQFDRDLEVLQKAGGLCRRHGIRLLYHNHDWEFAGGGIINALLELDDAVGFCPDIGWVVKGGADVVELLDRMGDRVGALHLKDFATTVAGLDTVILGEGVVDLDSAMKWTAHNRPGLWIIAEQDETNAPVETAVTRNAEFITRRLDKVQ